MRPDDFIESLIMKHGWEKYRKEGIEELKRLACSRFFVSKPAQITLLNIYTDVYRKEQERNLKGTNFYPDEPTDIAHKKASKNIKELRYSLPEFYKSEEGSVSGFELYFIAEERDYRLGIRPIKEAANDGKEASSQANVWRQEDISYSERPFLKLKYSPYLIFSISIIILGLIAVFFISGWIFLLESYSTLLFVVFLAIATVLAFITVNMLRLFKKRFVFLIHRYFLRASEKNLVLASYSGTCPVCSGEVELSSTRLERKGYIAKCRNNPDSHIFSFDHVTLDGEKV